MVATPAIAQDSGQRVEVTGSRIKRTDTETASPVQVLTREDIERTGKTSIEEVLRGLTVDGVGSIPASFSNGFASGSSAVSLRGLGVNSTLVLVNGRRMTTYGLADDGTRNFVDLNSLPLEAVERIEVLKDGASAIYGADAVGGVVNVILRKSYTGGSMGASYGQTGESDGQTARAFGTFGFGNLDTDKYNVFFTLEASKQKNIWSTDRGFIGESDLTSYGYYDLHQRCDLARTSVSGRRRNSPFGVTRDRRHRRRPTGEHDPVRSPALIDPGDRSVPLQPPRGTGGPARDRAASTCSVAARCSSRRRSPAIRNWGSSTPRPRPTARWERTTTAACSSRGIRSIRCSCTAR